MLPCRHNFTLSFIKHTVCSRGSEQVTIHDMLSLTSPHNQINEVNKFLDMNILFFLVDVTNNRRALFSYEVGIFVCDTPTCNRDLGRDDCAHVCTEEQPGKVRKNRVTRGPKDDVVSRQGC